MSQKRRNFLLANALLLVSCFVISIVLASVVPSSDETPSAAISERGAEGKTSAEAATDEPAAPTNEPQATYTSQPTYTPQATYTALPTFTPLPTSTRLPTNTPWPSSTPRPTSTPKPANTATPIPLPTFTLVPPTATIPLPTATSATTSGEETAVVTYVVDGDTIDVQMNGQTYRVRYIGMDTPEYDQTCGSEATQANAALVMDQTVRMVRDVSETDQYGRLLRYVYVSDTFVNGALVAGGWAVAKDYPPDTAMSGVLHGLSAQGAGLGCGVVAAPLPTAPPKGPEPIPSGCDPSYPTVCIPPYPPDLDCKDITYRRFQVLPPDPHGFDGNDNDGLGCESG